MKLRRPSALVLFAGCTLLVARPLAALAQTKPHTTPSVDARYTPADQVSSLPIAPVMLPRKIGVASIPTPGANAATTLDQARALAAARNAKLDRSIARARALPFALYHNQYIYTRSDTAGSHNVAPEFIGEPKFINNDLIHHYFSQVSVTKTIGLNEYSAVERANANLAFANAELEVARRGLTSTVVSLFYNMISSQNRVAVQQPALNADDAKAGDKQ